MRDYQGPVLREAAPAKINLALHVTGKRDDGYHLLDSLVVFAQEGDVVTISEGDGFSASGRFSADLSGRNLCEDALACLGLRARITLEKNLPVASGIGGGSADAAAVLRCLSRQGHPLPALEDISRMGADIPVCLASRASLMRGIGEQLVDAPVLPEFHLLLINPGVAVSTGRIFGALASVTNSPMPELAAGLDYAGLIAWLGRSRNDLQPAAIKQAPVIATVLEALTFESADFARMSGSGATCFGIYPSRLAADHAAMRIEERHPDWWVLATGLAPASLAG